MVSPELLRRYPFFGSLSDTQLKGLAMVAEEEKITKGSVVCVEGQPATALYLLIDGNVCLFYKAEDELHPETRKDFLVGEVNPGEMFAISAFIEPFIYTSTVKADEDSRIVRFPSKDLNSLIQKDPTLYCTLLREIAKAAMERLAYARVQLAAAWA
jgi:CRP-like cAMP-binding protein